MLVWRTGNVEKNCLCLAVLCSIIMVHKDTSSSYRSVDCIGALILLSLALFRAPLCLRSSWCCICIKHFFAYIFLYFLVSWAWRDWPLTWLTNHRLSVLRHCWLGHLTCKTVSEMTYNVTSGTLNSTIPYHTLQLLKKWWKERLLILIICATPFLSKLQIACNLTYVNFLCYCYNITFNTLTWLMHF